jgi:hypothetical protein
VLELRLLFAIFLINTYGLYTSPYFSVFLSPTFPYFSLNKVILFLTFACLSVIFNKHIWREVYLATFLFPYSSSSNKCTLPTRLFGLFPAFFSAAFPVVAFHIKLLLINTYWLCDFPSLFPSLFRPLFRYLLFI